MNGEPSVRLLICAGGTGGGVYPALAVLDMLNNTSHKLLWVGGDGGMEAGLVERQGIPFVTIPAAGVHGVGLRTLPGNLLRLARGVMASIRAVAMIGSPLVMTGIFSLFTADDRSIYAPGAPFLFAALLVSVCFAIIVTTPRTEA